MGGKDVIYVRQQHSSTLLPVKVQETLKELADRRFLDVNGQYDINYKDPYGKDKVLSPSSIIIFFLSWLVLSWSVKAT